MQWNRHRILLATPQGVEGSALVIAADRAGGLGILDGTHDELRGSSIQRMCVSGCNPTPSGWTPTGLEAWLAEAGDPSSRSFFQAPGRQNDSSRHAYASRHRDAA